MNTRLLHAVLKHAAAVGDGSTAADAVLLRTFAASRDPAAFAELVRRYGRLVWAVCRQLRPTDADAEDAFQATFLVLLRSAGSVRTNALGLWLHTVAHRIACKAGRADGRRRRREQRAAAPDRDAAVPPSAWDDLAAAVHDEVAKLPDHLRVPFVLCCLEGRGTTEAAKHLGWKLGTLSGRLTRAKQTLLARLASRGLPASAVAVTLTVATVPAAVAARAVDLVHAGTAVPATVLELAKGATTMKTTKLLAAAVMVAAGLAASVGGWLATADAQTPDVTKSQIELLRQLHGDLDEKVNEKKADAKWEYRYLPLSDVSPKSSPHGLTQADFERVVESMENGGWQFFGQVDVIGTKGLNQPRPTYVFRRPGGEAAKRADRQTEQQRAAVEAEVALAKWQYAKRLAEQQPVANPVIDDVRETILQRMRKDPAETFAAALAAKLATDPKLAAAVDRYGRTVLEVEVLATLLTEAQQTVRGSSRPRTGGMNPLSLLGGGGKPLTPEETARKEAEAIDLAAETAKLRQAVAAGEEAFRDQLRKAGYRGPNPEVECVLDGVVDTIERKVFSTFDDALASKVENSKQLAAAVAKYGRAKLEADVASELAKRREKKEAAEAAAILRDVQKLRDRKTVRFTAKEFGLDPNQLLDVLQQAAYRKFATTQIPITLTAKWDDGAVEAIGSPADIEWLTKLADGAKVKPKK